MSDISRKLASFRKISEIVQIPGADRVEIAKIDGWQVVTQKGWATPGKLVIYFEVDSFLPVRPEFEFLRKSGYREHPDLGPGFKLKTIKLRGELSQGLIMPCHEVLGHPETMLYADSLEGTDLTQELGVKLWEPPLKPCLKGMAKGNFPSFIPKTDQERVQNLKKYFERWDRNRLYQVTLKLDGSSMTVYSRGKFQGPYQMPDDFVEVGVCSRNLDLKPGDDAYWRAFEAEGLGEKVQNMSARLGEDIAVQGELMGPGVQGNREKFPELRFYVFDIWSITKQEYKDPITTYRLCETWGFRHVPVMNFPVSLNPFMDNEDPIQVFLDTAKGRSINHEVREGVVFKAVGDGPRHSFKVINNDFLLAEKD